MKNTITVIVLLVFTTFVISCVAQNPEDKQMNTDQFIIKKMSSIHCARGPKMCEKCREMEKDVNYCLLKLLPGHGNEARPIISVELNGEVQYLEYDIAQVFENKKQALAYSKANNVPVIKN